MLASFLFALIGNGCLLFFSGPDEIINQLISKGVRLRLELVICKPGKVYISVAEKLKERIGV